MDATEQLNARLTGRYAIERQIGRGGMATVYLARDLRHDRHVALKVLDPELGAVLGGERFLSEIRVTANLQHPNLLPLFDSGDADGVLFYVMPFVEGESLRAKLDREQQLPVDEAVRITVAIASAVDYAHRHGVIHRDLKPENILLHDDQPLVADFGIALAVSNAGGARITQTGLSLGTPQYMSPEQATGDRAVDGRTDVYSLGAMVYEMLAGEPPHTGKTAQAIIAKLMTEDARPVTLLRRSVPASVSGAIHRALQKLPADRFATAREFGDALQTRGVASEVTAPVTIHGASQGPWKAIAIGAAVVAVVAIGAAISMRPRSIPASSARVRFALALPDSIAINNTATALRAIELSPDGTQLAYIGGPSAHLFVRRLDEMAPRRLVAEAVSTARFSPDGDQIAFVSGTTLKRIPIAGGPVTKIAEGVGPFAWGSRGTIVFGGGGGPKPTLYTVSENGGTIEQLTPPALPNETVYGAPSFLPDGDGVLFPIGTLGNAAMGASEVAVVRVSDRKVTHLGISGANPIYLATGHVLAIATDGSAIATPFDPGSLKITGPPVSLLQDVMTKSATIAELVVSSNGTLAYLPGEAVQQLVEVDRSGRARVLSPVMRRFRHPRYAPDGRRIATAIGQMPSSDIWVLEVASGTLTRLTNDGRNLTPGWSADGQRVAWTRTGETNPGTYWRPWDLSAPAELLVANSRGSFFSPNGNFMITSVGVPTVVVAVRLDSTRKQTPIMQQVTPPMTSLSPDGRWLAYTSLESGINETYVRPVTGAGTYQISNGGGFEPMWNPRGGELFYRGPSHLISAKIELAPTPHVVRRDTLFAINLAFGLVQSQFDVSADGNHFLMPKPITGGTPPVIVIGWLDEIRERFRAAAKK